MPNFTPSVQRQGCRTPKLKFLLRFDQNVEYKRPTGAYPLRDFHRIYRGCIPYQSALDVEIWLDLLERLRSYGGFKLRGSGFPQICSAPLAAKLCVRPKVLQVQERARVLYHHTKFGGARISPAAGVAKNVEFFVCLFVTLLNVRDCAPDFAMKALEYRNDFDAVG